MTAAPFNPPDNRAPTGNGQGCIVNFDALYPMRHPSLPGVCWLAGLSLLPLGPLSGIAGIWLGGVVVREVDNASLLYRGRTVARGAVAVSWLGTLIWSSVGVVFAARHSAGLGYLLLGVTLMAVVVVAIAMAVPRALPASLGRLLWAKRVQLCSGSVLLLLASMLGIVQFRGDLARQKQRCIADWSAAKQHQNVQEFEIARQDLAKAKAHCRGKNYQAISAALVNLDESASAYSHQRKLVARKKLQREFKHSTPAIETTLRKATVHVNKRQWDKAKTEIEAANKHLGRYTQSHLASTESYRKLATSIASTRKRIDTKLALRQTRRDTVAKAKQKRAQAKQVREQAHKEAIERRREASRHLMCNDGTRSPSCLCSRASRRGCCSHHGGVAGCE